MPLPFSAETLATLRRRVGKLTGYLEWGQLTSGSSSGFVAEFIKKYPDNGEPFVGATAYIVQGTGAGQQRLITTTTQSTGAAAIAPNWTTPPDATSIVEVWSGEIDIETVNNCINLAIMDAQEVVWVPTRVNVSAIAVDFSTVTLPTSLIAIYKLLAQNVSSGVWTTYQLGHDPSWLNEHPQTAVLVGSTAYLSPKLNDSFPITNVWACGYRLPVLLVNDSDVADVRSDFLVYKAAVLLESRFARGASLDPDEHGGRAANWEREALSIRGQLAIPLDPDTQMVQP
jgi:hypothetical protein